MTSEAQHHADSASQEGDAAQSEIVFVQHLNAIDERISSVGLGNRLQDCSITHGGARTDCTEDVALVKLTDQDNLDQSSHGLKQFFDELSRASEELSSPSEAPSILSDGSPASNRPAARDLRLMLQRNTGSRGLYFSAPSFMNNFIHETTPWDPYILYQSPRFSSASPENVALLFHHQTSDILSIQDSESRNPWQSILWPLAKDNPALYNSIAAMTCLYMSKTQPGLRKHGISYAQESLQNLMRYINNGSISILPAIASSIALGFGETFDHKIGSTGFQHTRGARSLLRKAINDSDISASSDQEHVLLSFLAGSWLYMDVIARFTLKHDADPLDYDLLSSCALLQQSISVAQIDPLMGCAVTLFPLLARVADIVHRVRSRNTRDNSVAIVSEAAYVRDGIEQWFPVAASITMMQRTQNLSDALQTAEAYRWAALLLLRQAVPELAWLESLQEMTQKVLIRLASISPVSRTIVVHILPLTIAGCEATDGEDRSWVRDRWSAMSKRMLTGIVDSCLKVTEEVWRRRDEYEDNIRVLNDERTEHSVKSNLHWMGVMREWSWEGEDQKADVMIQVRFAKYMQLCSANQGHTISRSDWP